MWLRVRQVAAIAVLAIVGTACGGSTVSTAATAASKASCTQKTVRVAVPVTPPNVIHLPPYIALDLGYFKDEHLDVEIVRFEGGVGSLRSAAGGSVDLAGTSSEPMISAVAQGATVKAVYTYAPNVDVSFVVGSRIQQMSDLRGKKIGIQEPGGFADVMSRIVLRNAGIDPKDVSFVTTTTAGRVPALLNGTVDTGVLHVDQTLTVQQKSPGVHVLVNMWEILSNYEYSFFVTSQNLINSDPATVECMVRALMRADRAIYDPAKHDQIIDIGVKYTKEDRPVVAQTLDQLIKAKAWPQNEGIPQANVDGTIKSLKDNGKLTGDVSFSQVVDLSIAKKVTQQLGRKDFPY